MQLPRSRVLRTLGGGLAAPALAGIPALVKSQSATTVKVGTISVDIGVSNVATIAAARLRGLPFRFIAPAAVVVAGPSRPIS